MKTSLTTAGKVKMHETGRVEPHFEPPPRAAHYYARQVGVHPKGAF